MSSPDNENKRIQKPSGEVRGSLRLLRDPLVQALIGVVIGVGIMYGSSFVRGQYELRHALSNVGLAITAVSVAYAAGTEIIRRRNINL